MRTPGGSPDQGQPTRISPRGNAELPSDNGYFWFIARGSAGRTACYRTRLTTGVNYQLAATPAGRSLGLTFPLDIKAGIPGGVRLEGLKNLNGICEDFPDLPWQPCTVLKTVTAQIDGIPMGSYRVSVVTASGMIVKTVTVGPDGGTFMGEWK